MPDIERKPVESARVSFPPSAPSISSADIAYEKHYSVVEVAKLWSLSQKTVRRMFETNREPFSGEVKSVYTDVDTERCEYPKPFSNACIANCGKLARSLTRAAWTVAVAFLGTG